MSLINAKKNTESGIPAFRQTAEDDTWSNYSPSDAEYGNFMVSPGSRKRYWEMKTNFYEKARNALPNDAHKLFARLENENKLLGIVTQVTLL
jgi:NAD-dependent SIR2 family protein deacetylase